jgi:hypothetical protein
MFSSSFAASGRIFYSAPSPLFHVASADDGQPLGPPLNKVIVDINGDGYDDAIYHLFTQGQLRGPAGVPSPIVILLGDRNGGVYNGTSEIIAGPPPKALWVKNFVVEDFNRDGRLDIFACNTGPEYPQNDVSQWPGEQNQLFLSASDGKLHDVTATHLPQIKDYSHGCAAADVDGDGDIDIWVNNHGAGTGGRIEAYLMLNDGTGRFTIVAQAGPGLFAPHVGFNGRLPEGLYGGTITNFADVDNDGDADLIMWSGPQNFVLINDGTGRFSISAPGVLPPLPFGGKAVLDYSVAGDLNLDGYIDFIAAVLPWGSGEPGRYFQVLINNGNGTFSDQTAARLPGQLETFRNGGNPPFLFLSDLDGDGYLDFLAKFSADNYTGNTFPTQEDWKTEFYRNDGKGFFTPLPERDYFNIHPQFLPLDVDGDGITDFVNPIWFFSEPTLLGQTWTSLIKAIRIPTKAVDLDADGDGKADIAVYRSGTWFVRLTSNGGVTTAGWGGVPQDVPVPRDYDGDGKTDASVYRNGTWFIQRSLGGHATVSWGGAATDLPVPADYDGDGKADIAVYRDGAWAILRSSDGGITSVGWGGLAADEPVPADYDGDGKADVAIYRNGTWFIIRSSDGGVTIRGWGGLPQDIPVPGDYDGDGKTDIAVYRDGTWFIIQSSDGGVIARGWGGLPQDIPVPADYDGDGKADVAVYRNGMWFIIRSSDGGFTATGWGGLAQDIPLN